MEILHININLVQDTGKEELASIKQAYISDVLMVNTDYKGEETNIVHQDLNILGGGVNE